MPILSKLYRCFSHGLKICMWFGYYPEIIFCHFFRNLNLVIFRRFYYQSEKIVGTLCAQLLLQFYIDSFETSQVFCTWSEDMHVVWIYSSDYFLTLFRQLNLAIFLTFLLSKWMDSGYLVCASPPTVLYWFFWNFTGVLDMVWRYACGLDIILKLFFITFSAILT